MTQPDHRGLPATKQHRNEPTAPPSDVSGTLCKQCSLRCKHSTHTVSFNDHKIIHDYTTTEYMLVISPSNVPHILLCSIHTIIWYHFWKNRHQSKSEILYFLLNPYLVLYNDSFLPYGKVQFSSYS